MRYPYWVCDDCDTPIKECHFPLTPETLVPTECPRCASPNIDIAMGDENTELDTDTIIYTDEVI